VNEKPKMEIYKQFPESVIDKMLTLVSNIRMRKVLFENDHLKMAKEALCADRVDAEELFDLLHAKYAPASALDLVDIAGVPQIRTGAFDIRASRNPKKVIIRNLDRGIEGGEFDMEEFEAVVVKFYVDNF